MNKFDSFPKVYLSTTELAEFSLENHCCCCCYSACCKTTFIFPITCGDGCTYKRVKKNIWISRNMNYVATIIVVYNTKNSMNPSYISNKPGCPKQRLK